MGPPGADGTGGADGADGFNSLIDLTSFSGATGACTDGGVRIDVGIDDDKDGVLDSAEIDQTELVCNGATGAT